MGETKTHIKYEGNDKFSYTKKSHYERIRDFMNKLVKKMDDLKWKCITKASMAMCTVSGTVAASYVNAFAKNKGGDTKTATSINGAVNSFSDTVFTIFKGAGFMLALFGAAQLVTAMKNDDSDGKNRGMLTCLAGIALFFLKNVFGGIGLSLE